MSAEKFYFVWRETQKGPLRHEVWVGDMTSDFKAVPTIAKHQLSDDEAWKWLHGVFSLSDLAALYPAPAVPDRAVFP